MAKVDNSLKLRTYNGKTPGPTLRVRRGGSWYHGPQYTRLGNRSRMERETRSFIAGFRVVREMP